jgi:histidine triad (HIT) family protein
MSADCIFCKIATGQIPVKPIAEDEVALAFADLNPQAPTHILVIPKQHVESLAHVGASDWATLARVLAMVAEVARKLGLDQTGYRTVFNAGRDGGQTVHHLHAHLLGGRAMQWPPG